MKPTSTCALGSLLAFLMFWGPAAQGAEITGPPVPHAVGGAPAPGHHHGYGHHPGHSPYPHGHAPVGDVGTTLPPADAVGTPVVLPPAPWVSFDGWWGSGPGWDNDFYRAGLFVPREVTPGRDLVFSSIYLGLTEEGSPLVNLGLGIRRYSERIDRVFGANAWYDFDDGHERSYHRVGGGLETLGRFLDARVNGYAVVSRDANLLVFAQPPLWESSYSGFDAELGGPVPFLGRYGLSSYTGLYYLLPGNRDFFRDAIGFKTRLDLQVTDDLNVGVQWSRDREFGSSAFVTAAFTFPDGVPSRWFRQRPVRERFTAPVVRDYRIHAR